MTSKPSARWVRPLRFPTLRAGEIHVWRCAVGAPGDETQARKHLDEQEIGRAARLRSAAASRRFVAARGALREIAARYLGVEPTSLRFAGEPRGKPRFVAPGDATRLRFNLSHSGDLVLLAFCLDHEVGVDVERTARDVAWPDIASRYFTPLEARRLSELPAARRRRAFFVCWSCKEAVGKALGEGLAATLTAIEVPVPLGDRPVLVRRGGSAGEGPWYLRRLAPGRGYVGALASSDTSSAVRLLIWDPPA